jgi:hypothetical protein
MISTLDILVICKWVAIATLGFAALAGLGFALKWGIRFRLVGITGFMAVLTVGLFGLGQVPFVRTTVPGSVPYTLVFDNGAAQAVITIPASITASELDATLRQAAQNVLRGYGRLSRGGEPPTVRARALLHPKPGLSKPVYIGQIQISGDELNPYQVEIFTDKLAEVSQSLATQSST